TVSGTIQGLIQDQQGAVVAKTEVTTRNLETGAVRKTNADDNGAYRIFSIPAGPYEVSASAPGFRTEVRTGIAVTVGSDISVNFSLTVGAISEQVQVTSEASQVDAFSSTLGGFVNSSTIRELSVLTNNSSAEYGRGASGVVNAITKSGTNDFHGSAYYFHRNSALDARNFFDGPDIAPFRRHQYGGAIGGPIRKDKTFFFS